MSILSDVQDIATASQKILNIASAVQQSQVPLLPADMVGETILTLTPANKTEVKQRAVALILEIKTKAAGLPSQLP